MHDDRASREELISELQSLRQRVAELERSASKDRTGVLSEGVRDIRELFDSLPIPAWEEDFSLVKARFTELRDNGVNDFASYFDDHPEEVQLLASLVRIIDVNSRSLTFFGVADKDQLTTNLPDYFTEESWGVFREEMLVLAAGGTRFASEILIRTPQQDDRHLSLWLSVVPGCEATLSRVWVFFEDVTECVNAQSQLSRSVSLLQSVIDNSHFLIYAKDLDGRFIMASQFLAEFFGQSSHEELLGKTSHDFLPRQIADQHRANDLEVAERQTLIRVEEIVTVENEHLTFLSTKFPLFDDNGMYAVCGVSADITDRKRAEEELRASEEKYRVLAEGMKDVVWTLDAETMRFLYVSPSVEKLRGYTAEEIIAEPVEASLTPVYAEYLRDFIRHRVAEYLSGNADLGGFYTDEVEQPCKDGSTVWTEVIAQYYLNENTGHVEVRGATRDISERKEAQAALLKSEERFRQVVENAESWVWEVDADGLYTFSSPVVEKLLGYTPDELVGRRHFYDLCSPADREVVKREALEVFARKGPFRNFENATLHKNGGRVILLTNGVPILDAEGCLLGYRGSDTNITERKRAEEQLKHSGEMMQYIIAHNQSGVAVHDRDMKYIYVSQRYLDEYNIKEEDVIGKHHYEVFPDLPQKWRDVHQRALKGEVCKADNDPYELKDGSLEWTRWECRPWYESDGSIGGIVVYTEVITERKHLEDQLRQSQKMEAVGQLAGGVAHDFNNLLQVILGHTESLSADQSPGTPGWESAEEVRKAAERAAELTRQLLAFGRRQIIQPINSDINDLIQGVLKMVWRIIGEHIELHFVPGAFSDSVFVDKGQMEQVLMNLCVNARDAMPKGGRLTIATEIATIDAEYCADHFWAVQGRYVLLSVSDTGGGMDAETRAHIFEPFFTTKGVGEGTGLGLATVYGIVNQHKGLIHVYSEPEAGTVFRIYLPSVQTVAEKTDAPVPIPIVGGTETILVAEDESAVLKLVETMLTNAGYKVLTAVDGIEALRVFEEHKDAVSLVVLDVMMPGMSGREVMDRINEKHEGVRFLFSSGYSENAIHSDFVVEEGLRLIEKPYRRREFLREVRQILDMRPNGDLS